MSDHLRLVHSQTEVDPGFRPVVVDDSMSAEARLAAHIPEAPKPIEESVIFRLGRKVVEKAQDFHDYIYAIPKEDVAKEYPPLRSVK